VTGRATPPQRLLYLGTPELAVPPLQALAAGGFEVVGVVTRADARRGRGGEVSPSPVKAAATALGIPVVHRVADGIELAEAARADLGVVVAYGALVKPDALARLEMVNLHFSLLPRWRGAAPVERALLAGDVVTGVCLMHLDEGLDTGPVHARVEVDVSPTATGASLRADLVRAGTELLLGELRAGLLPAVPQVGEAVYAAKLTPDDLRIDWASPAATVDRVVRLGGAWTTWRGKRLKVHGVTIHDPGATGDVLGTDGTVGGLRLDVVQPEGKPPTGIADFLRGARLAGEDVLGS
jgi:methionyl-tRNA formyltransferase